jgi:glyoxylase I family protein
MIDVETLHHVSISVTDLTRARHFYGEVLGLLEITRPPFDFPGAWYQLGDRQLHLLVHAGTHTLRGTTAIDSRDKPRNLTPWPQIYVTDPDGNVIEFNAERLD